MKYATNDIECQTRIQGMSLSEFCDYLRKREGSCNSSIRPFYFVCNNPTNLYEFTWQPNCISNIVCFIYINYISHCKLLSNSINYSFIHTSQVIL